MYSYTAPQANGDGPVTGGGGGGGGGLSADDFSEPTANGTYQSMATGVRSTKPFSVSFQRPFQQFSKFSS